MTPEQNIKAVRREGAALAAAARGTLDKNVPSCPEWNVSDLVWHVGGIHRHRVWLITEKPDNPRGFEIDRPADDAIIDWYGEGVEELARELESHDPSEPCWTWFKPDQTVGFWQRRMAQETAVHRWDGENAARHAQPIEPVLAADGIDEFFDTLLAVQEKPPTGNGETVHVHSTDAPSEWHLTLGAKGTDAKKEHAKADAAIRGPASDVLLALWRRVPLDTVQVLGDRSVAGRFLAAMDLS